MAKAPRDPALWGLIALALGLRGGLLLLYPHLRGLGDEAVHYATGVVASRFGPSVLGHWPPLYDGLLGVLFRAFGPDPLAAKIAQVLLSTLTVALVYGLARRAAGVRAGRIAGALCALDPSLVAYTHYLFSETLFTALLVGFAWVLFRGTSPRTRAEFACAGILLGLAILTRSALLYFLPLWAAWEALRRGRAEAKRAVGVVLIALAVVLPWTVRNAVKYRGLLLVDGTLGRTAYFAYGEALFNQDLGFLDWRDELASSRPPCRAGEARGMEPLPSVAELATLFPPGMHGLLGEGRSPYGPIRKARELATLDLVERQRCELRRSLEFAVESPGTVFANVFRRPYGFWGPNSFLLRWVHSGVYSEGPLAPRFYPFVKWLVVAAHVLVVGAALLSLGRREPPRIAEWSALLALYFTAIHALAVSYSRYRLPLMPFLMVGASLWLAQPRRPEGRGRGAVLIGALVGFVLLSAHYVGSRLP